MGGHILREGMLEDQQNGEQSRHQEQPGAFHFRREMGGNVLRESMAVNERDQDAGLKLEADVAPAVFPLGARPALQGEDGDATWWEQQLDEAEQRRPNRSSDSDVGSAKTLTIPLSQDRSPDAASLDSPNVDVASLASTHASQAGRAALRIENLPPRTYGTWEQNDSPIPRSCRSDDTTIWSRHSSTRYRRAAQRSYNEARVLVMLLLLTCMVIILIFMIILRTHGGVHALWKLL
jgi:hypothetical protein